MATPGATIGASRLRAAAVCAGIAFAVGAVYGQVASHSFLEFDDGIYVTDNPNVRSGLGLDTLVWAFTNADAYIWHPLTWLSYLVDSELYGIESAAPWLLTNVALHLAASLALLGALVSLTQRFWPSAFVAALFALHPLQVEPVAWVSGRKEVLAGLFSILTVWAWARHARRPGLASDALVLGLLVLAVASKGTAVALPLVLLLLDYWPLGRLRPGGAGGEPLASLLLEKLPFLLTSLGIVLLHLDLASGHGPWIEDPPLAVRAMDGVLAWGAMLARFFWPDGLAIVTPTATQMGLPRAGLFPVALTLAGLAAVTALAAAAGRRRGYLLVGWLWFLGTLVPVLGLVPFGLRVMHDRYAYVPMIGLSIAVGFAAADLLARLRAPRIAAGAAAALVLLPCAALSWRQVGVWRDSRTLFDHALAVTRRNAIVHYYRGNTSVVAGDLEQAVREFEAALAIQPRYVDARNALGRLHLLRDRPDLAIPHLEAGIEIRPDWSWGWIDLGRARLATGDVGGARRAFERALSAAPESGPERAAARRALARLERGAR